MMGKITLYKFLNSMVIKPIEITPEWVLSELPQSLYADGMELSALILIMHLTPVGLNWH
jgi:hypothetical protein